MAQIAGGIGTSHSPMLLNDPQSWRERAGHDEANRELYDRDGVVRDYAALAAQAGDRHEKELDDALWWERHTACGAAIGRLAADAAAIDADVVVVVGDDQSEVFDESVQPAVGVYWGEQWTTSVLDHVPPGEFFDNVKAGYAMDGEWTFPGSPDLALDLLTGTVEQGFELTSLARMPAGRGFGHAYGYVARGVLSGRPVPIIPVLLNTYYPPNQPTARRCYELGRAMAKAVAASATDHRVMFVASGGLSHFVVNEELDRRVLDAIASDDGAALSAIPQRLLNSGSSEIRNWITVAGAMSGRAVAWSSYVPCYRTPAGTGCGMAFLRWE